MARSLIQAHDRVKGLDWEHTYVPERQRYATEYHIPAKTKDPFRHLLRDFLAMEKEKDDRAYGSMLDVLARTDAVNQAAPEFSEIMKALLPMARDAEYYAMQTMMMVGEAVQNSELRQGYLAQELDEVRHVQAETWLNRYYAKHYADPAGFNVGAQCREWNPIMMPLRAAASNFIAGDPVQGCLNLQVVIETAYTNALFVAMTEVAAQSGDQVLPSLFLSIQSDEGRHMANGYATLSAILTDDRNLPLLQQDLDEAFWRQHHAFDVALGLAFDYARDRTASTRSYQEYWNDWIWHDWAGSYIGKLEKFGLQVPAGLSQARQDVPWMGHTGAMFTYALWPLNFWRQAPVPESSFEWFEDKYPGWYSHYGPFWEDAVQSSDPANGSLAIEAFPEIPPICRVCVLPCVFPRVDKARIIVEEYQGTRHPFCSHQCQELFRRQPEQYLSARNFGERFDGWALADAVVALGLLREDGRTLTGQPHLSQDRMWTIDDIRKIGWELKYSKF
jgi:YHS domain-containing protein